MAAVDEILYLSRVYEEAVKVLDLHHDVDGSVCGFCGIGPWPCLPAHTATQTQAWCRRRVLAIDSELWQTVSQGAGVLTAA